VEPFVSDEVVAAEYQEETATDRVAAVPLAHLSVEIGHLYMEDFAERAGDRLVEYFERLAPWVRAARDSLPVPRPRISTCFLIDDYFARFSSPAELVPVLLEEAERAGLEIDYLARESGCALADKVPLAESVAARLVASPPPGTYGIRPPVTETGWLANGERSPAVRTPAAMQTAVAWQPPKETAARRHSVFLDTELWSDDPDGRRTWSCPMLAAVWQLARLGLLRHEGEPVFVPQPQTGSGFPDAWDDLPPLLRLNKKAAPFAAYRTCSVLPNRFLPVEHAVRVVLDQVAVDPGALLQVTERSAGEGVALPDSVADRVSYVFHAEP
jgi:hypothetical protein